VQGKDGVGGFFSFMLNLTRYVATTLNASTASHHHSSSNLTEMANTDRIGGSSLFCCLSATCV